MSDMKVSTEGFTWLMEAVIEEYLKTGGKTGASSIEQIARVYGNQAVVVSIDSESD